MFVNKGFVLRRISAHYALELGLTEMVNSECREERVTAFMLWGMESLKS